ncbi:MAG: holo-ACP synthase [Pseudomonadota bacterium]
MIVGVGVDIIDIRRIERTLARFGDRFTSRCFTQLERQKADGRRRRAETYAKRFAAKEACSKALGTGYSAGVFMRDIGVVNLPSGQPTLLLTGGALARLRQLVPVGLQPSLQLTITDEPPLAQAFVLITAAPA